MRRFISYGVALAIIVVVAIWMSNGVILQGGQGPGEGERPVLSPLQGNGSVSSEHAEGGEEGGLDPNLSIAERNELGAANGEGLQSVRIAEFVARPKTIEVPLRGRTEAKANVAAVAQTSGTVEEVLVAKGQSVAEGDLLCRLDQGTRQAALAQAEAGVAQAEAALDQAQANFENNETLRERGVVSANSAQQVEVALRSAQANLRSAEAGLNQAEAELERTEIRAKVPGLIQDPLASVGQMLSMGGVCATVVQLDPIVFVSSVPEARIGLARTGLAATLTTIAGTSMEGEVSYVSATADEATHTFRVEIEVPNENGAVRDGLSAQAIVNVGTIPAHLLPQSALTLNDEGELGVRTVEDGIVKFYVIQIIADTREGVWVTGLPLRSDVITLGQEDVSEGQMVDAATAPEGSAS
jgi:multidrug efflux system membrane fusion protein